MIQTNEKSLSFGKNSLFEIDIETLIPDVLDAAREEEKEFYVKVRCKNKEEVRHIISILEKMGTIEKKGL
jgi:hypothetical protein